MQYPARPRKLLQDPNLRILFGVTLMAVIGVSSIMPAFPTMARELGVPLARVGLLITVFTLPGVAIAPVLGVLADRVGRRRILVPALVVFGLSGLLCALARDFQTLLLLRFVQGLGAAALSSLNSTIISDMFEGRERLTALGLNAAVLSVGTALFPAMGGLLAMLHWWAPFLLHAVAIPLAVIVHLRLKNPEPRSSEPLADYFSSTWRAMRGRKPLALFGVSLLTFAILYGPFVTFFPILLDTKFAAKPWQIGLVMSAASLFTALGASQLGRLSARFREERLLLVSFGFYALSMLTMPAMPALAWLVLPATLFGAAQGLNIPSLTCLLARLAPMDKRAAFMSVNSMVLRGGQTVGPLLGGVAFGMGAAPAVFWMGAGLAVVAFALAFWGVRE